MNPGFDVRSVDETGAVRVIEVKATKDRWGARGVGLSSFQFGTAQQRREDFWLYVVENALTNPRVHPIRDPASKIDQYVFDDGWRVVSDAETTPRPAFEPLPLLDGPDHRRGAVPYFEATNAQPGVAGAEDGWLVCRDAGPNKSWFTVRIPGYGLGLAFYGGVALIERTDALPQDGDLTLVRLQDQWDPDSGSHVALRRWMPERDLDGKELALRLWSDSSVEPLTVTAPDRVRVLGLVRATFRVGDLGGDSSG
jgi:hypothetical protein